MSEDQEASVPISPPGIRSGLLARLRMSGHTYMLILAILVGCLGGLGAVGFRLLIQALQAVAWGEWNYSLDLVRSHPWWWIVLVPTVGGMIVGPLVHFLAREAKGHGVPEVMEAVAVNSGFIRVRVVVVKSLASAITIASGGSVGREGPIVQIGAALGSSIGQLLRVSGGRLRTLAACGAAAGIAATFNAPVAGALFAVEIILGDFGVTQFSPIVISSVIATVVSRHFLGDFPAFEVPVYGLQSPWELLIYLVLAGFTAVVAATFIKSLYSLEDFCDRLPIRPWLLTPIGGLIIGLIGLRFPEVFGVGYEAIDAALSGDLGLGVLASLLVVKLLATGITISTGGSGGVFAPSLFLGAMAGGLVGVVANELFPTITAAPGAYALVGMGAVVSGATHAPITAILIIFELTNDYQLIVPLMGACIISTLATTRLKPESIYTLKLLRRGVDISAGRELNILRSQRVEQVMVTENDGAVIGTDTPLAVLLETMTSGGPTYSYVVDSEGRLQGVVGPDELRTTLLHAESLHGLVNASDLLRQDVPTVTPDQDLDAVMRIFGGKNREELPVIDSHENRRFVGTITRDHLLEAYKRELHRRDMVMSLAGDLSGSTQDEISLGGDHWMAELPVPSGFRDRTLRELDLRQTLGVQVVLVRRRQGTTEEPLEMVPQPDTRLQLGDAIVVMGPRQALRQLRNS